MAITWSNKGITVRKSHRGSIPAVRSLFIVVRFRLLSAFEGILEIDYAFGNGHNGSFIERQSKCEARAGTRPTQNRFADSSITAPSGEAAA